MPEKPPYDKIVPVHARYDQQVEVHWRMSNGKVIVVKMDPPELQTDGSGVVTVGIDTE